MFWCKVFSLWLSGAARLDTSGQPDDVVNPTKPPISRWCTLACAPVCLLVAIPTGCGKNSHSERDLHRAAPLSSAGNSAPVLAALETMREGLRPIVSNTTPEQKVTDDFFN